MTTNLKNHNQRWGELGKMGQTHDGQYHRMIVRVVGDACVDFDITEPTDFIIEEGSLEVCGTVADDCRFYLLPKKDEKIGVLGRLFGKVVEPLKMTSALFLGVLGKNIGIYGTCVTNLSCPAYLGAQATIDINPQSRIYLGTVADGLHISGARKVSFENIGNKAELYRCGVVSGKIVGGGCSIITDEIDLIKAGSDCHFRAKSTAISALGSDSSVEGILKTRPAEPSAVSQHLRLVR